MASPKIERMKIMRIINDNVVRGRFSENYLTRKSIARNICDLQYYQLFKAQSMACMHDDNIIG